MPSDRRRRIFPIAIGFATILMAGMVATPQDQKTETIGENEGFFTAVIRGGCDSSQLAQVMVDNNVRTEQLSSLRKGFVVHLFPGCEKRAVGEVAKQSNRIIVFENERKRVARKAAELGRKVTALRSENTQLKEDDATLIASLRNTIKQLTESLEKETRSAKKFADAQSLSMKTQKVEYGAGGIAVTGLIVILWMAFGGFKKETHDMGSKVYEVEYWNQKHIFKVHKTLLSCPISGCGRRDIQPLEVMDHLDGHSELRTTADPVRILPEKRFERVFEWMASMRSRFFSITR